MWFGIYRDSIKTYTKHVDMMRNTSSVLQHRTGMLHMMQQDPVAMMNPAHWIEINRMVWEKILAYGQANATMSQHIVDSVINHKTISDPQKLLKVYAQAIDPIQKAVKNNATRLSK